MARRRTGRVIETTAQLRRALSSARDTAAEPRLRMLLALRDDPTLTMSDVAGELGYSERQVRRWWTEYTREGIAALLGDGGTSDRSGSTGDAARADRLARFMNAMPTTIVAERWMRGLQAAIKELLGDVDTVLITIAFSIELADEEDEGDMTLIVASMRSEDGRRSPLRTGIVRDTPSSIIINQAIGHGFPAAKHREPVAFDFHIPPRRYVGTIVLWNLKTSPPVSQESIELMRTLESFIAFALSDCIARSRVGERRDFQFQSMMTDIGRAIGLGSRELEVFALHFHGTSRRDIAEHLSIAEATVSKHIASIHRKAGTRSYTELLARFFAPDPQAPLPPRRARRGG